MPARYYNIIADFVTFRVTPCIFNPVCLEAGPNQWTATSSDLLQVG